MYFLPLAIWILYSLINFYFLFKRYRIRKVHLFLLFSVICIIYYILFYLLIHYIDISKFYSWIIEKLPGIIVLPFTFFAPPIVLGFLIKIAFKRLNYINNS